MGHTGDLIKQRYVLTYVYSWCLGSWICDKFAAILNFVVAFLFCPGQRSGEAEVLLYLFSNLALEEGERSVPRPRRFTSGKEIPHPL